YALPMVVHAGGLGCGTDGYCEPCGLRSARGGLLDRLRNHFGLKSSSCGCVPAPAPACNPCNPCSPAPPYHQPNLCDKLKARWAAKSACPCPCPNPCATAVPPTVVTPGTPADTTKPKDTVKPKDSDKAPKNEPKSDKNGNGLGTLPALPVAP